MSTVAASAFTAARAETDNLFTYFPGYTFTQITPAEGYKVTQYNSCHVVERCSSEYGLYNCNLQGDVAVLRCDDRPWLSPSIAVAPSDPQTGSVYMGWFHEVYNMPTAAPTNGGGLLGNLVYNWNEDRYQHYTLYPGSDPNEPADVFYADNFHYFGGTKNQLLPLYATPYTYGDIYVQPARLGFDAPNNVVWTDLFGCHGTSGSGILQSVQVNGKWVFQLLGPVSLGASNFTALCVDPTVDKQGNAQLGYTPLTYTQAAAKMAAGDFPPIVWTGGLSALATAPSVPAAGPGGEGGTAYTGSPQVAHRL